MGKQVFLTGGTGGLGIPVVRELLENAWTVTVLVRSEISRTALKRTFPDADTANRLQMINGDVIKEKDLSLAIEQIGRVDALVHLAGGFKGAKSMAEQSEDDFQSLFSLNVLSAFLLLKNILPLMKKQEDGSIVMIGAKPALYPAGENAVYAASKAALTNLVRSAAEEGRAHGVRANLIVPAVIDTPENRKWVNENTKTKNWTAPEDIARSIAWLISEEGRAVTGTVLPMFNKIKTF